MKIRQSLLMLSVIALLVTSCTTSDSETLKRARSIQDETFQTVSELESSLSSKMELLKSEMAVISMDSTMATDSVKIQSFDALKNKQHNLETLRSEMLDWKEKLSILPSSEEIASGAANPFGDKTKDQEVLAAIKTAQEELSSWKSKVSSALSQE